MIKSRYYRVYWIKTNVQIYFKYFQFQIAKKWWELVPVAPQ